MGGYCRAYKAENLRHYPEWHEQCTPLIIHADDALSAANGHAYLFVHDDFVVTAGIHHDEHVVFDRVTEMWKVYCRGLLAFVAPGDDTTAST